MKYKFISLVLICSYSAICQQKDTSEMNSGILYGKNHAFFVTAPDGWILDNQNAVSQGVHAAFYPKGGSWESSPVVMYANGYGKESKSQTIYEFIAEDSLSFIKRHTSIKISDASSLKTGDNKKAIVKWFYYTQYEAVAYISESKSINIIVLSARTEEQFKKAYSAFEKLVSSYQFFTDQVTYPEK